jgi:hypothetical protein
VWRQANVSICISLSPYLLDVIVIYSIFAGYACVVAGLAVKMPSAKWVLA